ncbi:hypothetical protein H340_14471 [Streptomyces mobaraensis NBRC 13819 = DSM 40847]|uniref:Uncharacterized protein n=1 Tax=Streptomyces mobaraensis (strain ATCC 29032 / DSM 40847 / JCM 4168 / NBRC 13819 / NCIMB 11159 / IPCR 16-22) TaxID=1223523 RepID=M3A445_STRM1|nr:hypothetical protein H340_14471 [Streptomyces mobaraensis NBRC 13819 = DSM 40847]
MVVRLHGEDGYKAKWVRHPFPVAALQDLRRLHLRYDNCERRHGGPASWTSGGRKRARRPD